MSVLILGGAGYIGSHTAFDFIERGLDVVILDNLQSGHREALHPKARFYEGDIRNSECLDELFKKEKIDSVVHFAANSLVAESMSDPLKYYDNNLMGTMVLLKSLVKHNIKKIVFSSTAATYGEPQNIPITEDDVTNPTNTYGETKLAMEKMFKWVSLAHGVKFVSLRYFNAAGAHKSAKIGEDHSPETHLIPIVLQVANNQRESVLIYGDDYNTPDGTCIRDYIHVSDLASAHYLALEYLNKGNDSNIFNLGNGVGFSVKEVIEAARSVTGHKIPAIIAKRREGDPARLIASSKKAREILGWQPKYTDLREIIETAWMWHKNNPKGFRA